MANHFDNWQKKEVCDVCQEIFIPEYAGQVICEWCNLGEDDEI